MTVGCMLKEILASRNKSEVASMKLVECIKNAVPIAIRNAPYFTDVSTCLTTSCSQYWALVGAISKEETLALIEIPFTAVVAFQMCEPEAYMQVIKLLKNDKTK